ncbi:HEPN domain-containing protein [bacterium]|nr:HEPN domain-containing protein [bacterium]
MSDTGMPTSSGWLLKAQNHLRSAEALSRTQPPLGENACFHVYHAVTASLRAFLFLHNITISTEKNLAKIHAYAKHVDSSLSRYDMIVELVDPYKDYVDTIDTDRSVSHPEMQEAITNARQVVRFVTGIAEQRG